MQNKKLQVWLPILFSLVMIAGMFIGYRIKENMPGKSMFFMDKRKPVAEVINPVKNKYVDEVNIDSLTSLAVSSMLAKLDPHSVFMPATELQQVTEELEGKFYGIGVEFNIINDTINVISVIQGGPSDKAGIKMGDKIIKAADTLVAGVKISSDKIRSLLKGSAGSKVNINILRDNEAKQFTIVREAIPIYSLDAAYMLTSNIGYIRLNKFAETTYVEFMTAAEKLQKQGMQHMILDLRDNGGGVLSEATEMADEFLDDNKMITYTEGLHSARKEYRCKRNGIFEKGKLVVLVNEYTASASEVLAGALQDWDRATILGRRTFGKGLVQEQFELSDGSGLRLTVARYYTPLGRSIQKSYSGGTAAYMEELHNRLTGGELVNADSIKHGHGKKFTTASGKVLYGEGAITPDVFVPADTTAFNKELTGLYIKGTLNVFAYENYLNHKSTFSSYTTPADFEKNYTIDNPTWESFKIAAVKDSVNLNNITPKEKDDISRQLKRLTARQLWHTEGYFEVTNAHDPMVLKALDEIRK
jgi:carboxyl-terminal processing protease